MRSPRPFHPAGARRGVALLAVLAVLALLTVLVVVFLLRAQLARNSAANYRATTSTRLLSDTVVNLVEAEINDATTYGSSSGASGTGPYTWASQPGAIRVFDSSGSGTANNGGTGFQKIYRLYSAPSLTTTNITDILNTDTTPTSSSSDLGGTVKTTGTAPEINTAWATMPAQWVDLNAPVTVADPSTTSTLTIYPILDNRNPSNTAQCVQLPGFYVNTLTATTTPYPAAASSSPTTLNPPVMPVQWLYVLQNGQIVAATGGSGTQVTFTSPNAPSAANPIVGRIAYWTDDDTCKLNINTAGGSVAYRPDDSGSPVLVADGTTASNKVFFSTAGTASTINAWPPAPWDTPRYAGSWDDLRLFAADQPVQGEYQRYPGHPATTILYYVFRALGVSMPEVAPNAASYPASCASSIGSTPQAGGCAVWPYTSSLYGMLPRYNDNAGSQGGLAWTTYQATGNYVPPSAITPNRSRLYTSLGELLYSTNASSATPPVRTQNGVLNGSTTPTAPYLTRQQIETGKFFLTAHSRAPETTLFGTPRICIWPVPDTTKTPTKAPPTTTSNQQGNPLAETALDKLIAFCTTTDTGTGGTPCQYYFQRYDSMSQTNDWNKEPRNQALYGYLQDLTSGDAQNNNIPGYANGSFLTKYGSSNFTSGSAPIANERDQILTEMFDYIRCTNLNDHSWTPTGTYTYDNNPVPTGSATFAPKGEVVPLQINTTPIASSTRTTSFTQGLGRLLTLSEIGLHVICTASGNNNLATLNATNTNSGWLSSDISGSSVLYVAPVAVTQGAFTGTVSPVKGSASDPAYVSNLPVAQYLRDTSNNIVDIFGNSTASGTTPNTPFPANPTLSSTGTYGGTLNALSPGSEKCQAMLIFEPAAPLNGFDAMMSYGGTGPDMNIFVSGSHNIPIAGQNPFPSGTPNASGAGSNGDGFMNGNVNTYFAWINNGDNDQGGVLGFRFPMNVFQNPALNTSQSSRYNGWSGVGPLTWPGVASGTITSDTLGTGTATEWKPFVETGSPTPLPYRFVSNPFTVSTGTSSNPTMSLGGSSGTFTVALTMPTTSGGTTVQVPYQIFNVAFPPATVPAPTLCAYGFKAPYNYSTTSGTVTTSHTGTVTTHAPDWWSFDNRIGWANEGNYAVIGSTASATIELGCLIRGDLAPPTAGWGSGTAWKWSDTSGTTIGTITTTNTSYGDVVRSIVPNDADYRVSMAGYSTGSITGATSITGSVTINAIPGSSSPSSYFAASTQNYSATGTTAPLTTDLFREPTGSQGTTGSDLSGSLINPTFPVAPSISPKVTGTITAGPNPQTSWDWDTGYITGADGAYANKPDEGSTYVSGSVFPYTNTGGQGMITSYFTANRIIASPVAFGSLPTGVAEQMSWRNLLFRPQMTTAQGGKRTSGASGTGTYSSPNGPEDELLLDNFWMPVVQPYAISEPFSTAGKINMNYQILPFTYITRSTGVQAVLASELVARVPGILATNPGSNPQPYYQSAGNIGDTELNLTLTSLYKDSTSSGAKTPGPSRLPLNLNDTVGSLRQFRAKFMTGDVFRSPAEICDIYLVPEDSMNSGYYLDWSNSSNLLDNEYADYNKADAWYGSRGDFALVGNNVRDKPYSDIYPRLTTKSNSYTVYYRVQALQNPPNADPTQWTEGQGVVTGEYRGSTSIERYLDPNNNTIPDYTTSSNNPAVNSSAKSLDSYYQWRTTANTAFAP